MMKDLLQIELRLLFLRYGKRGVLDALATLSEQTLPEIEADLRAAEERKRKRNRKSASATDLVGELSSRRPEVSEALRVLANRYENRTFLPQVRDVHRFLDRTGSPYKPRSRRDAAKRVMTALSRLDVEELNRLLEGTVAQSTSDYAQLAREIMGKR